MMKLLEIFTNHSHYWGVPHRSLRDDRLIQTCYECSAQREVKVSFPHSDRMQIALAPHQISRLTAGR
jgi:hypothetical protein